MSIVATEPTNGTNSRLAAIQRARTEHPQARLQVYEMYRSARAGFYWAREWGTDRPAVCAIAKATAAVDRAIREAA
jgi:hypothetical protein